jgi:hypothetical protein
MKDRQTDSENVFDILKQVSLKRFVYACRIFILKGQPNQKEAISIVKPTRYTSFSNLLYFGITLYKFRAVFPSIVRSSRLYIHQQEYVKQIVLPAWQAGNSICLTYSCWCMYSLELLIMDGKTAQNM